MQSPLVIIRFVITMSSTNINHITRVASLVFDSEFDSQTATARYLYTESKIPFKDVCTALSVDIQQLHLLNLNSEGKSRNPKWAVKYNEFKSQL